MVVWKGASFLHFLSELSSPKRKVVCSNRIGNIREGYKPCKKRYIKA